MTGVVGVELFAGFSSIKVTAAGAAGAGVVAGCSGFVWGVSSLVVVVGTCSCCGGALDAAVSGAGSEASIGLGVTAGAGTCVAGL